jgi:hypothetical protein
MTYFEKLVACIKANGQILREIDGTVTLPFGCEYSILVKNLDSVRIQVSVSVDGQNATENARLIIQPNSSVELERFIRHGNLSAGNRFKFIERSKDVEDHRGIGIDDGLVRVEAWREVVRPVVHEPIVHYYDEYVPRHPYYPPLRRWHPGGLIGGLSRAGAPSAPSGRSRPRGPSAQSVRASNVRTAFPVSDAGITVAGSESHQQFYMGAGFETESQSRAIILKLRGQVGKVEVARPVTVKCKPTCVTCGKVNRADTKFCANCGTALTII